VETDTHTTDASPTSFERSAKRSRRISRRSPPPVPVSKNKTDCEVFSCIDRLIQGMGNCRGERAICSREWLTAPPLVLLPQQKVTELLQLVTTGPNSSHQPSTQVQAELRFTFDSSQLRPASGCCGVRWKPTHTQHTPALPASREAQNAFPSGVFPTSGCAPGSCFWLVSCCRGFRKKPKQCPMHN
jgi:hypothetical protein